MTMPFSRCAGRRDDLSQRQEGRTRRTSQQRREGGGPSPSGSKNRLQKKTPKWKGSEFPSLQPARSTTALCLKTAILSHRIGKGGADKTGEGVTRPSTETTKRIRKRKEASGCKTKTFIRNVRRDGGKTSAVLKRGEWTGAREIAGTSSRAQAG